MNEQKIKEMRKELLESDTNIFHLYKVSRVIPFSPTNKLSIVLISVLSLIISLGINQEQVIEKINNFSPIILGCVATITGFLIAGYTVFCSVTEPKLSVLLHLAGKREYGISKLKITHLKFIRVFIYYIFYVVSLIFIIAFSGENKILYIIFDEKSNYINYFFKIVNLLVFNWIIIFFIFLLIQLGAFVFNIYHSIMTAICAYPYTSKINFDKNDNNRGR